MEVSVSQEVEINNIPLFLSSQNTPESAGQKCKEMMKDLVEVLAEAEVNEEIMDAYLDDIVPSQEVVLNAVKEAVQSRKIVPVLCGSAAKGMGADALDEFVVSAYKCALCMSYEYCRLLVCNKRDV